MPGNIQGAYFSIVDEIKRYIKTNDTQVAETIKVKIAGDGSRVSRVSNFIVLSMPFLNENVSLSTSKLKTLAILKCEESYEMIEIACSPLFKEINSLIKEKKIMYEENKD